MDAQELADRIVKAWRNSDGPHCGIGHQPEWGYSEMSSEALAEMAQLAVDAIRCGRPHPQRPDITCTDLPHQTGPVYCRNRELGIEWWDTTIGLITVHDQLGEIELRPLTRPQPADRYVHLQPAQQAPEVGRSGCPFCGFRVTNPLPDDRRRCAHCACEWNGDTDPTAPRVIPDPGCPNCGFHRALPITDGRFRCARYNCHHEWDPDEVDARIEPDGTPAYDDAHPVVVDGTPAPFEVGPTRHGKTDPNTAIRHALRHTQSALSDTRAQYHRILTELVGVMTRAADGSQRVADKYHSTSKHINVANYHTLSDGARELREAITQIQSLINPAGGGE